MVWKKRFWEKSITFGKWSQFLPLERWTPVTTPLVPEGPLINDGLWFSGPELVRRKIHKWAYFVLSCLFLFVCLLLPGQGGRGWVIWEKFQHAAGYVCLFTGAAYCSPLGYKKMPQECKIVRIVVVLYLFIFECPNHHTDWPSYFGIGVVNLSTSWYTLSVPVLPGNWEEFYWHRKRGVREWSRGYKAHRIRPSIHVVP